MKHVDILTNHNGRPARILQRHDQHFMFDNFPKNPTRDQALAIGIAIVAMCSDKPLTDNLLSGTCYTIVRGFNSGIGSQIVVNA